MPRFYACSWTYGVATTDDPRRPGHTQRAATYRSFPSRAARDAWVAEGASYRTERDFREAIPSDDEELRRHLAQDERDGMTGHMGAAVPRAEDLQP